MIPKYNPPASIHSILRVSSNPVRITGHHRYHGPEVPGITLSGTGNAKPAAFSELQWGHRYQGVAMQPCRSRAKNIARPFLLTRGQAPALA